MPVASRRFIAELTVSAAIVVLVATASAVAAPRSVLGELFSSDG